MASDTSSMMTSTHWIPDSFRTPLMAFATVALISACSSPDDDDSCGPGPLGTSCQATADCKCNLYCYNGTCLEVPMSGQPGATAGQGQPDAQTPPADAANADGTDGTTTAADVNSGTSDSQGGSGEDAAGPSDTSTVTDASSQPQDTSALTDSSAVVADVQATTDTGTNTNDTGFTVDVSPTKDVPSLMDTGNGSSDAPPPNTGDNLCNNASLPTGKGKPFTGYSYTTKNGTKHTFTCTLCPGGVPNLQGTYRFYVTENCPAEGCCKPNEPCGFEGSINETFSFDGNVWTRQLAQGPGAPWDYKGYFFCPDPNEYTDWNSGSLWPHLFVFEELPSGSSLKPNHGNPCNVDLISSDQINLQCNQAWNGSAGLSSGMKYCKVGSSINGVPCTHPFE